MNIKMKNPLKKGFLAKPNPKKSHKSSTQISKISCMCIYFKQQMYYSSVYHSFNAFSDHFFESPLFDFFLSFKSSGAKKYHNLKIVKIGYFYKGKKYDDIIFL
jgi:hypothetical protein